MVKCTAKYDANIFLYVVEEIVRQITFCHETCVSSRNNHNTEVQC